ncbi:MAG: hypothetical protein Q7R49_05715 [Candidatus Daviesbacteria bacterium]|nr:hypothetical protein [Candidatus Daviesbacteria bacterium]
MNRSLIILSIIGALCIFAVGGGLGVFYQMQTQKNIPQVISKPQEVNALIKALSSKVVTYMTTRGEVTKIDGKDITLSSGGDSIKITTIENIPTFPYIGDGSQKPVQGKTGLKEIKVGDNLSIIIKILPDGQIQGQGIFIINPTPPANTGNTGNNK